MSSGVVRILGAGARPHTNGMSASPSSSPLAIAVIGLGGIGSMFAYHLARAGHAVTAIARPGSPRLAQLQRDGGLVTTTGERAAVRVADALDEATAYDLVVVTTLAHQVDAVLPALQRSPARHVQFMFNTFDPERLRAAVGAERCSLGMPFVRARVDGAGAFDGQTNPGQKTLHGDPRWADVFRAAGLPSAVEPDMALWLRCHVPMCIAFESISIAGERRGGGASWAEAMTVARGMRGGFAVLRGLGYRIYPSAKAMFSRCPTGVLACLLWSISRITSFRELLATGTQECRALVDGMSAAATGRPTLDAAVAALTAARP